MISSHAAESADAIYLTGISSKDGTGFGAGALTCTELTAITALAEQLHASPSQVDHFVRHAQAVPPRVLLSWICLWYLKRGNS